MTAQIKMTRKEAEVQMACFRQTFSSVRLLNEKTVLHAPQTHSKRTELECRVLHEKRQLTTLDVTPQRAEQIFARYVEVDGEPCVLELVQDLQQDTPEAVVQRRQMLTQTGSMGEKLYRDALTGLYNRRYYEDALKKRGMEAGVAVLDMDGFKACNETYGHQAGDKMLEAAVGVMRHCVRRSDTIIRYGGDEFLLVLPGVTEVKFAGRLQEIHDKIHLAAVPGYAGLQLSVSIGGTIAGADETIGSVVGRADRFMYQAKTRKNLVVTESNEIKAGNADGAEVNRDELKQQILIVDDAELNRDILAEILHHDFKTMEVSNGEECLSVLREYGAGISLVLLDIVMPGMDGFAVLEEMNRNHWIEDIPVIMISSEETESYIRRAYEMGVSDYISRPFDAKVVYRRVYNTIKLYAKQRRLITLVTDQIREKEKNSQILIDILSHIVEFRNGESGQHVQHIKMLTGFLLDRLMQKTDKYDLKWSDQYMITIASALHDIGKVGIDEKILNKPGRLTNEEFEEMKKHTLIGASMLKSLGVYQDEELVKVAYQICRWHHERYDGKGYPDGLKGEEIPIAAQVVSVADVYDALTSERVYKKAFSHEKAMEMILAGECGTFNPLLLECLQDIQGNIQVEMKRAAEQPMLVQNSYVGKMIETVQ